MTDGPKQLSDIPGVNVPAMRAIQADWPDTCEWLANHIWSLEMRLEASRAELAAAKAECERLRGILRDVANATSHDNLNLDMAPYVATKALIMDELKKHKDELRSEVMSGKKFREGELS